MDSLAGYSMSYKEIIDKLKSIKVFPLVDGIIHRDIIRNIFPLKQREVDYLLHMLVDSKRNGLEQVKSVWIFGSSITSSCSIYSDLDIGYELNDGYNLQDMVNFTDAVLGCKSVASVKDPQYDIILLNTCGDRLRKVIQGGLKIYDVSDRKCIERYEKC